MTIFSRIIKGEIPCFKVAENDKFFAFLDINPVQWGHTLVVPKEEIDYIFDLSDRNIGEMMQFAKHVAEAIKKVVECRKVGVAVIGLEVPHAHIHLVPITHEGDLNFGHKFSDPDPTKMAQLAEAINSEYSKNPIASSKN